MAENGVLNVNFNKFMANTAKVNWNAVMMIYRGGNPNLFFSTSLQAWIR